MSSRKRTCLIFHSSSSLNSHLVREVFSQHQKDPEKKLVELGTSSNCFAVCSTQKIELIALYGLGVGLKSTCFF